MNPPDYRFDWKLRDGTDLTIRTMRPDDAVIEQDFVRSLCTHSKTLRFFAPIKELSTTALRKFTNTDFPNEMALIATVDQTGQERQIGVARYAPSGKNRCVEFAVVVADNWRGKGIATELLRHLFNIASESGIDSIEGFTLHENKPMLTLAKDFGFEFRSNKDDPSITYVYKNI